MAGNRGWVAQPRRLPTRWTVQREEGRASGPKGGWTATCYSCTAAVTATLGCCCCLLCAAVAANRSQPPWLALAGHARWPAAPAKQLHAAALCGSGCCHGSQPPWLASASQPRWPAVVACGFSKKKKKKLIILF